MTQDNNNTTGYTRKRGFFGSVKDLGVTATQGTELVLNDSIAVVTNTTSIARTVTAVASQATTIWGEDLLEDLTADREINRLHRQIDNIQQTAEVDALKAQLATAQAKKPVGRPANKK